MPLTTLALASFLLLAPLGGATDGDHRAAGLIGARAVDVDGAVHRLGTTPPGPLALVFIDTECPVANRYVPRLNELAAEARESGVAFYGVYSDPALTAREAREHRDGRSVTFPVLFDASGDLAERLGPTRVPEAFVVDGDDRLVYRGRIDDRFESVGRLRTTFDDHDLLDALRVAGRGEAPAVARTPPVGCVFEAWSAPAADGSVTYARDVAPILDASCVECHRVGDIAPFPLATYEDARRRARMIAEVCEARVMPPWHATPGFGAFRDERVLSERQVAVLVAWADAGAPEGDPAELMPAPPRPRTRWRLGEPDLLVEMPVDFEVPASGDDIYRYFVVPSELTKERTVVAVDFRPGDPSVVHHCIAYLDHTGGARAMDERSERPGFSFFGADRDVRRQEGDPRFRPSEMIAGWAPGAQPYELPPGVGMRLAPGGDFVLEVHYHLDGKATTDRSALALYFADGPVERYAEGLVIGTEDLDIPPGTADYRRHVWMELPTAVDVIDVSPHMHYLGKDVDVFATLPDGTREPLIRIDRWDFRWQGAYVYREPVRLPKGTRIDAHFSYDNSSDNPFNPSSPPRRVTEGWRTTDEMCLFFFTVVPTERGELRALHEAMFASFDRSGGR